MLTGRLTRVIPGASCSPAARCKNMQRDAQAELNICFKRSYDEVLRHQSQLHHTLGSVGVSVIHGLGP